LIFGLNPKDFFLSNNVSWGPESPGIKFGKYGVAYTEPFFEAFKRKASKPSGFSFEISLKPKNDIEGGFNFIIVLHNGKDSDQLLMGQWRTHIIFMNGDDYNHKRGTKRISIDTATLPTEDLFITVTTGKEGTKIYYDGQLLREKNDLTLKIPNKGMKARLIIGNSVYGRNSWKGTIYGLAFYRYELTPQNVFLHYDQWLKENNFSFAKKENPYLLYLFDGNKSSRFLDYSSRNNHINIPSRMKILKKKFLSLPNNLALKDLILNLIGFIPFGFSLTAALIRLDGAIGKRSQLMAVFFGFLLSLTIESIQYWAPIRDSSIQDLILNTFGTAIGAAIYRPVLNLINFRD
jgi:VanZ family protein